MDTVFATNVRMLRDVKHWTQQHLADVSGVDLRTVQRVEKGTGASLETLQALSNALEVPIEVLQADLHALLAEAQRAHDTLLETHSIVAVQPITKASQFDVIGHPCAASVLECLSSDESARRVFSALTSHVREMVDLWTEADALEHGEWCDAAFNYVEGLGRLGIVTSIGRGSRRMATGTGPLYVEVLYVIACSAADVKDSIAVTLGW